MGQAGPKVGDPAPDFTLPSTSGAEVTLSSFRGKRHVLLAFFPLVLVDFKREVSRRYGTLLEEKFFSRRAYFLIDKQGTLRWTHTEPELGQRREDDELLRRIRSL